MAAALRWLLDTNTVSEAVKPHPSEHGVQALPTHHDAMALPATVLQELRFGWLRMPEGRQKRYVGVGRQISCSGAQGCWRRPKIDPVGVRPKTWTG
jgi:hypothetical protein